MRFVKWLACAWLSLGAAMGVQAQFFNVNFGGGNRTMENFTGSVKVEPSFPVVGVPCAFVFSFTTKDRIELQQVMGLPDHGVEYLADSVEPHADGTYRLPVRFTQPLRQTLALQVAGMQTVERGNGTSFRSSFSTNFRKQLPPYALHVRPLPEEGKPSDFCGVVGTRFTMKQKLVPDHVRPGDLVTATYELTWEDGYCPSNIWPTVERLSKEFKAYDPKEVARTAKSVTWTQVLVPRTVAATNSALVSVSYYNSHLSRYEYARARPVPLVFVSAEAASTQNTSVTVAGDDPSAAGANAKDAAGAPLQLRFAPSEGSPVVATLPPGTEVVELARQNGWRRVSTPKAIGWCK